MKKINKVWWSKEKHRQIVECRTRRRSGGKKRAAESLLLGGFSTYLSVECLCVECGDPKKCYWQKQQRFFSKKKVVWFICVCETQPESSIASENWAAIIFYRNSSRKILLSFFFCLSIISSLLFWFTEICFLLVIFEIRFEFLPWYTINGYEGDGWYTSSLSNDSHKQPVKCRIFL